MGAFHVEHCEWEKGNGACCSILGKIWNSKHSTYNKTLSHSAFAVELLLQYLGCLIGLGSDLLNDFQNPEHSDNGWELLRRW